MLYVSAPPPRSHQSGKPCGGKRPVCVKMRTSVCLRVPVCVCVFMLDGRGPSGRHLLIK